MSRISCPACGTRLEVGVVKSVALGPPLPMPTERAVLDWLRTVTPGIHLSRDLHAAYSSDPSRPLLSSKGLGAYLARFGAQPRRTKNARYWHVAGVPQAKSADLGAVGQAN